MKITDIAIHVLKSPLAEPFAFSQGWVRQRSATLVEVMTDQRISGWGEAFAQGLEPPEIAATVIDKALRQRWRGAVASFVARRLPRGLAVDIVKRQRFIAACVALVQPLGCGRDLVRR